MTSKTIYQEIKPTYLYIKQHSITKKKYFGKTTKKDPYKYSGSGSYWIRHYKKHGKEHIKTLWVSDLYYDTSIVEVALHFSIENNIVGSEDWANLKPEDGLNGGSNSSESVQKILDSRNKNGNGADHLDIINKILDTKRKNGTMNSSTPESVQRMLNTKKERGIQPPMRNQESVQRMIDTKKERGTSSNNLDIIQKAKDTKKERGIISPFLIPFLTIINTRKTYAKSNISRWFPYFKQYY